MNQKLLAGVDIGGTKTRIMASRGSLTVVDETIITDGLRSYKAAMTEQGCAEKQQVGRHANNRAENSHLPVRRRERAMLRFRRMKTLQKFASVHASVHNHFSHERHLVDRQTYKKRRSAAWAEWKLLAS